MKDKYDLSLARTRLLGWLRLNISESITEAT